MKIEVPDETEKVGEFECYKFICTPKEEYNSRPVTIFIDTKAFLARKMVMVADTQMGPVKMESIFSDYKAVNKLMTPMLSTIKQMGMVMMVKVIEIKDNVNIDDSEFEKPEPVE
jgi:outer membrane lipoprotein-sorting protein